MYQTPTSILTDTLADLTPFIIIFFILASIASLAAIAYVARLWYVQSATFKMQKDIAAIKDCLLRETPRDTLVNPDPAADNRDIQPLI